MPCFGYRERVAGMVAVRVAAPGAAVHIAVATGPGTVAAISQADQAVLDAMGHDKVMTVATIQEEASLSYVEVWLAIMRLVGTKALEPQGEGFRRVHAL